MALPGGTYSETSSQSGRSGRRNVPAVHVSLDAEQYGSIGIMPWFSYTVNLPTQPILSVADRPHIKTPRLIVRPITREDLEAFHELRRLPEVQNHSTTRGRPDRDIEETRHNIERLQPPHDGYHWYFGAFLASTGEMIGEGGLPDCSDMPRSGWPEAEILIKPEYWRQGYGTELLNAVLESWWDLPRERRRHQLLPVVVGDKEPGDYMMEGVGFVWEEGNVPAREFFASVLGQKPASADGSFVDFDRREGREGSLVRWNGALVVNPKELDSSASGSDLGSDK